VLTTIGAHRSRPLRRCSSLAVAFRHTQIRSRINRLSGHLHREI
jgi:hypothetical protein